jgi:hypothetical protein
VSDESAAADFDAAELAGVDQLVDDVAAVGE